MPCLPPEDPCPCFTVADLFSLFTPSPSHPFVLVGGFEFCGPSRAYTLRGPDCDGDASTASDFDVIGVSIVVLDEGGKIGTSNTCFYRDVADTTDPKQCDTIVASRMAPRTITEEQAQSCYNRLTSFINAPCPDDI